MDHGMTKIAVLLILRLFLVKGEDSDVVTRGEFEDLKKTVNILRSAYITEKAKSASLERRYESLEKRYIKINFDLRDTQLSLQQHKKIWKIKNNKKLTPKVSVQAKEHLMKNNSLESMSKRIHDIYDPQNDIMSLKSSRRHKNLTHNKHLTKRESVEDARNIKSVDFIQRTLRLAQHKVAFYARDAANTSKYNLGIHQTIVFNDVVTNVGDRYNKFTGIFVCDTPGLYVFYVKIISHPPNYVKTALVKNDGEEIGFNLNDINTNHFSLDSVLAIVHVNAGDSVWVWVNGVTPGNGLTIGGRENVFSGFLLYPD